MKKSLLFICIVLVISAVAFVSCKEDPVQKNQTIGNWVYTEEAYPDFCIKLEIKADQTGTFTMVDEGDTDTATFIWSPVDKTQCLITMKDEEDVYTYTATAKGSDLIFASTGEDPESITFHKELK